MSKSTDHQTPESSSSTGHLNPGRPRNLQCTGGYKGGNRLEGMDKEGVWGFTTFFRTKEAAKSSPEIASQAASESESVWGQNLLFSGGNWPKRPKKEKLRVCVIAHLTSHGSGALEFTIPYFDSPDDECSQHCPKSAAPVGEH